MAGPLHALVAEYAAAPGVAAFQLTGIAIDGCVTYATRFATAADVLYLATDGTGAYESGSGTFTNATVDTISRSTVVENHLGTTAKVNFTGSVQVMNVVPSDSMVYATAASVVLNGGLEVSAGATLTKTGAGDSLQLMNPGNSGNDGSQIKFEGTTFDAFMRVVQSSGDIQLVNDAYSTVMLALTQTGDLSTVGEFTATGKMAAADAVSGSDLLTFQQFAATLSANGASILLPGLYLKWGSATTNGSGIINVTYPVAFPTATLFLTGINDFFAAAGKWPNNTSNTTRFVGELQFSQWSGINNTPAGSGIVVNWLALGY